MMKDVLLRIFRYFLASISLALFYYAIFALLISTDTERKLQRENKMFKEIYPEMKQKEEILSDAILQLQIRDNQIYTEVFDTPAPTVEQMSTMNSLLSSDTIPDGDIVRYAAAKLEALDKVSSGVEETFRQIYAVLDTLPSSDIPMTLPLKNLSYAQVGASVGGKINPFYKVESHHTGIDLIAPAGTPVYATAPGVVTKVVRSRKGKGNNVTVSHEGGYFTIYAHLADIEVRKGTRVKTGTLIGNVGATGNTYAPHLHYEVLRDTLVMDPINHFFGAVSPKEYSDMLLMSTSTRQSLD